MSNIYVPIKFYELETVSADCVTFIVSSFNQALILSNVKLQWCKKYENII